MEKTTQQLKAIFTACKELGVDDDGRSELVIGITDGRSSSCKDLTFQEAKQLIEHLNKLLNRPKPTLNERARQADNMRKKILGFFHEMNYRIKGKIDMEKVEETILKKGYLKKPLNAYTYNELPKLVTQMQAIRNSYIKNVSR